MIEHDLRRARRAWRDVARRPLARFVVAAGAHAIRPLAGRVIDDGGELLAACSAAAARMLDELADRGAFVFFGITCSAELGDLPIRFVVVDDIGSTVIDPDPIVEAILYGAAAARGWRDPSAITISDLER